MAATPKPARKATQTLLARINADPALKAKYLKNPGLRSRLPDAALTPQLRRQRATNTRLNAPIVPGSSTTGRQLSQMVRSAGQERYGEAESEAGRDIGRAEGLARDTGGWYDDYLRKLAAASTGQQAIGNQAVAAQQGLMDSVRGLDGAAAGQMQQAASADAAVRGATAGDVTGIASGASTARQGLAASFGSTQAGVNAANSGLANTRANVVGPGQKLQAQAQGARGVTDARAKLADLKRTRGAFETSTRATAIADELKNVLAQQALGVNAAKVQETARATTVRDQNADADRAARSKTAAGRVNPYGYTEAEWRAMSTEERRRVIASDRKAGRSTVASDRTTKTAHDRKVAQNTAFRSKITTAADDARYLQSQQIDVLGADGKPTGKKRRLTSEEMRANLRGRYKDALIATAAMELAVHGRLNTKTIRSLEARGVGVPKAWKTSPPASQTASGGLMGGVLTGAVQGAVG